MLSEYIATSKFNFISLHNLFVISSKISFAFIFDFVILFSFDRNISTTIDINPKTAPITPPIIAPGIAPIPPAPDPTPAPKRAPSAAKFKTLNAFFPISFSVSDISFSILEKSNSLV